MKIIDVVILLILASLVALAIRYIVKRKKSGRPIGCTGDCSACALNCNARDREGNSSNVEDEQNVIGK